ncbi:MAG: hypothetical protein KJ626_02195 [Verrucomicrobia bacterium]|nr:hypothetical protein [Verrucomicrobiota bacterium]
MQVKKIDGDYEFTCSTDDGAFLVKLILTADGEEHLNTQPTNAPMTFPPRILKPGTIRKAIGEERWENFERMKDKDFPVMFIDSHDKGFVPHNF